MNTERDTVLDEIRGSGVREVRVAFMDYNGLLRARSVTLEHLPRVLVQGINFSSSGVSFNSRDLFPANAAFDLASPDVWAIPDPTTYRAAAGAPAAGEMYADLVDAHGEPWAGCSRTALRRAIARARDAGLSFNVGFEPEGYVFRRANGEIEFVNCAKFATLDGLGNQPDFMHDLLTHLSGVDVAVEQWTEEYGPGQIEVNLHYAAPLEAADTLSRYRQAFRVLADRHGLVGTFMPKPFEDQVGSGLHVHLSAGAVDGSGVNLFDGNSDPALGLSDLGRYVLAGLLRHGPALTALGASTVNSYKRFLPGSWAPTHVMYAYASRAAFIRVPERETARRLELRIGDPAGNQYLFLTGILAAALDGIEQRLDPGPPMPGDVGRSGSAGAAPPVPRTLAQALDHLAADDVIRSALGPVIVDEYLTIKRSEWEAFLSHVGSWDRDWYLGRY
ncbi:MAG: type I glutamate--ammonia ligase [Chloroflexota bacterium]